MFKQKSKKKKSLFSNLLSLISIILTIMAIVQEIKKPKEERKWTGHVAGFVPYDLRPPTLERIRKAYWDPDNPQIFTTTTMGVGWAINIPSLVKFIQIASQGAMDLIKPCCAEKDIQEAEKSDNIC